MKNITQEEWKKLIEETDNKIILDVRTSGECSSGIQENAIQLNFLDGSNFVNGLENLDKSMTYFVYCRSGNRSEQACQIMESKGFNNLYNLIGGMMHWNGNIVMS